MGAVQDGGNALALKDLVSSAIASLALVFTVGTFWWNNWRKGGVTSAQPRSFYALETADRSRVLMPIVLQNSGPRTLALTALRMVLQNPAGTVVMPCVRTYKEFKPDSTSAEIATNSILPGRDAKIYFCEFETDQRDVLVQGWNFARLDVLLSDKRSWKRAGDCSFYLSEAAFRERMTRYVPRDNSNLLPI